ncbi:MAG: radical SAM protein [Phocaeicola sp.]|uniref:radical SAM protein n=1 Tax=Phocaeicola sp. TaxID=2773926 RepID=UPI003FA16164
MSTSIDLEERLVAKADQDRIPITANFELTPTCTLNCDMCFIHTTKSIVKKLGGLRSVDEWLDLAEQLKEMGTLFILLTGGEPMLYPGFKELYIALRKMGFILTLNSNGTLIDEETIKIFAELQPRRMNITLYGTSSETYERLCHNVDGYQKTMKGLRLLKQYHIDTKINVSVVEKNKGDYKSILATAKELGMPVVVNSYMSPCTRKECRGLRDIRYERMCPKEAAAADIEYYKYKYGEEFSEFVKGTLYRIDNGPYQREGQGLDCRAGKSSCWINWRHIMTPCVAMESPAADIKGSTIAECWKKITTACDALPKHEECAGCKIRSICDVCFEEANEEKRAFGNLNYLCEMTHHKKEILESYALEQK